MNTLNQEKELLEGMQIKDKGIKLSEEEEDAILRGNLSLSKLKILNIKKKNSERVSRGEMERIFYF